MSKLSELIARMGEIEFGEEEDADLAARASEALDEQEEVSAKAEQADSEASAAKAAVEEAEARAADAEARAEAAEAKAVEAEEQAETAVSRLLSVLEEVRADAKELRKRQTKMEEWRDVAVERHGLVSSSDDEASNRAGKTETKPLATEEEFEAARANVWNKPLSLFRSIMNGYRREYGDLYDRADAAERTTERSLGHIRALQAIQRPEDKPRFVDV